MAIRTAVGAEGRGRVCRVLVCDDERHTVKLIQVFLERHGHQVFTAYDGQEALDVMASERVDVVILDVMMPRLDGFEVVKRIRQNPATENLPVIMLTAKAQDDDVFKAYHYGADMYLTKPLDFNQLLNFLG